MHSLGLFISIARLYILGMVAVACTLAQGLCRDPLVVHHKHMSTSANKGSFLCRYHVAAFNISPILTAISVFDTSTAQLHMLCTTFVLSIYVCMYGGMYPGNANTLAMTSDPSS